VGTIFYVPESEDHLVIRSVNHRNQISQTSVMKCRISDTLAYE